MPNEDTQPQPITETKFKLISIDLIDDPARPLRTDLSPESVEDLVVSIRQVGIIEPLVVRSRNGRYEVIAGHRRLVAATIADLVDVPCYILKADDDQTEVIKIHENLYRQEISPSDQAEHFDYLIKQRKLTPAKIAQLIGKSEAYVFDRLTILNYEPELLEALNLGKIKFSVARQFARIEDKNKLKEYLSYAIKSGITPNLAKQWVDDYKRQNSPQVQNNTDVSGVSVLTEQPESTNICLKCTKPVKLSEAVISYLHQLCYNEVVSD